MERGAWWATVHGVAKSQTWLSNRLLPFKKLFKEMLFKEGVYEVEILWGPKNAGWFGSAVSPERETKWRDRILTNKDLGGCQSVSTVLLQCSSRSPSVYKGWLSAGGDRQERLAATVTYNLGLCDTDGNACETSAKWPGWWQTVREQVAGFGQNEDIRKSQDKKIKAEIIIIFTWT